MCPGIWDDGRPPAQVQQRLPSVFVCCFIHDGLVLLLQIESFPTLNLHQLLTGTFGLGLEEEVG